MHPQDPAQLVPRRPPADVAWSPQHPFDDLPEPPNPSASLDRLMRAIRREWRVFLLCAFVIGAFGALFLIAFPPQYTGEAVVMAAPRQPDVRGMETTTALMASLGGPDVEGEIQLMSSPEAIRRVVAQLRAEGRSLVGDPLVPVVTRRLVAQMEGAWTSIAGALGVQAEHQRGYGEAVLATVSALYAGAEPPSDSEIAERIARHLRVSQVGRSTMVKIEYASPDPALAADMANAIAQGYIAERFRRRVESEERATQWLRARSAEVQPNVVAAEQRLVDFRASTLARGRNESQLTAELEALNREIVQARVLRDQAASRLAAAEERVRRDGPIAVLDWDRAPGANEYVDRRRSSLADARLDAARVAQEVDTQHPRAQLAEAHVHSARAQIEVEARSRLRSMRTSVDAADRQVQSLEAGLREVRDQINAVEHRGVQLGVLEREAQVSRAVFEGLLSRLRTTEQTAFNEAAGWVVSTAALPRHPSSPNLLVVLGATAVMAMGMGMSVVLYREYRAGRTIRGADDVWRHLGAVRQLGLIPEVRAAKRRIRRIVKAIVRGIEPVFAEAIASVQTSLLSAIGEADGRGARVVLVSSALPLEGKSSTVASLAAVASASGKRVVVVDCDLRTPRMHRAFGTKLGPGLARCLQSGMACDSALSRDRKTGVWLLPAGKIAGMPQGALRSPQMAALLAELRPRFDLVLLDTPPVLSVADARVLAPAADAAILVVRWAKTPWAAARLALRLLADDGVSIAGVAIAQVNLKRLTSYEFPEAEPYRKHYRTYFKRPIVRLLPAPASREMRPP